MKRFLHLLAGRWAALLLTGLLTGAALAPAAAQAPEPETEKAVVAAIAPYPTAVRQDILLASQYPQTLHQLQQSRGTSQQAFQQLIGRFDQKKQGWCYELTRYPDILHSLANQPKGLSESRLHDFLGASPSPELATAAWNLYRHHAADLRQLDNLNQQARQSFDQALQPLPGAAQDAFRHLMTRPDVLTLLTERLDLTQQLGRQYQTDAPGLTQHLTALHDSLAVQDRYEAAAYQQDVANNPQAAQELSQAAQDYARENGYIVPPAPTTLQPTVSVNYYANPYSYWFGYPSWYGAPLWYPGAFWADFGLGYGIGWGGGLGWYGFPPYGFSRWFFEGSHYSAYPHLYQQFGAYYHHNLGEGRVVGSLNSGFMGAAHGHFSPQEGGRLRFLTSPGEYVRPRNAPALSHMRFNEALPSGGGREYAPNAPTYHAQGWGGGTREMGGFSRGEGGHSFGGGGMGGGRGRR